MTIVSALLVLLLGPPGVLIAATLTLFGLARLARSVPAGFAGAGAVLAAGSFVVVDVLLRLVALPSVAAAGLLAALVVIGAALVARGAFLRPLDVTPREPEALPDVRTWTRPDGLPIAYLHLAAEGAARGPQAPVVYLHGGPGGYALTSGTRDLFARLARRGFDVYLYDQVGGGRSGRPARLSSQTVDRHVEDLEFVRQRIGARSLVLVGQSWGARLAVEYAAHYPQHVERIVLTSPGGLSPESRRDKRDLDLPDEHRRAMDRLQSHPRVILVMLLARLAGPDVARRFAPDREMDAWFDAFTDLVSLGSRHRPDLAALGRNVGAGFYANQAASWETRRRPAPIARLADLSVPTLVMIGESDYLGWSTRIREYRAAFPRMTLLLVPDAGHALGLDRPELHTEAISAFVRGAPLPLPEVRGEERPTLSGDVACPRPAPTTDAA
ncbi:alpha/beta hydrolase [Deinococcus pimensis]|uniref:alpha/beta hydrolase n=1 Tax=Deinococcus pimensis TaxID=309888 RepID=UPI000484DC23|nr:alpha/beta hydrolase [Deinococcus pimensis]